MGTRGLRQAYLAIAAEDAATPPGEFTFDIAALLMELGAALRRRTPSVSLGAEIQVLADRAPPGLRAYFYLRPKADERRDRLQQRNRALQVIAVEQYPNLGRRAVAREIARDCRRYAATQWRFDQHATAMPAQYQTNRLRALLYEAFFATAGDVPASSKQIARILKPIFS